MADSSSKRRNTYWCASRLQEGDDIRIRIGEAELASKPIRCERPDPASVAKAKEKYLENAAKRLGWKIVKKRP